MMVHWAPIGCIVVRNCKAGDFILLAHVSIEALAGRNACGGWVGVRGRPTFGGAGQATHSRAHPKKVCGPVADKAETLTRLV